MNLIDELMDGLYLIKPKVFVDERGCFMESYNKKSFDNIISNVVFIQDNESKSYKGVVRGLHFQNPPFAQTKLVRCITGKLLDITLDLRKNSKTYGKTNSVILSESNKNQLFIPEGFAHGFIVLSEFAIFSYKVNNHYSLNHENGVLWNDPKLKIDWKLDDSEIIISEKDKNLLPLSKINNPF